MLNEIIPGDFYNFGVISPDLFELNGELFLSASDMDDVNSLFRIQGNVVERITTLNARFHASAIIYDILYYHGNISQTESGLFRTDGTPGGSYLISDIPCNDFYQFKGLIFFRGFPDATGYEPYCFDPSNCIVQLVQDINPGPSPSFFGSFSKHKNNLLLRADNGTNRYEIYIIDKSDDCASAFEIKTTVLCETTTVDLTGASSSNDTHGNLSCGSTGDGYDIWFQVSVPDDGNLDIETLEHNSGDDFDTVLEVYRGDCNGLTSIACDDDGGNGLYSKLVLQGLIPDETLFLRVIEYDSDLTIKFNICVQGLFTDQFLAINGACEANLLLEDNIDSGIYAASDKITINGSVGMNKSVTIRAGNSICLMPNFEVSKTSVFQANIENCNN